MKIAFNPSTVKALTTPPNNKDITFDLRGQNIFARGVKFCGTDTNTWRDIKINNVSIGSNTLDLRNGSNTTLTNTNGVVTINSTWRPVVDNLTSDSTTSSLSANQGRVLKALIDGKSDSDHNHDDRYLKLTGGWMSGDINFGGDNKIYWGRNSDSASISFKNDGDGDDDSYMSFVTSDNGNEYFRWSHSSGSTNTEWMALRSDGLRVGGTKVSLEGHSHNDLYYTKTEVNNKLNGKSDTGHTHDDRYLKLTGGTLTGDLYINTNLYGPAVGNNPRNRYDSGLYFFNCNNSTTSTYNFGLYQWDNEFQFTYRTSADNLWKGNSFTIQGSDGQVTFTKTPKVGSALISLNGHTHAYLPLSGGTMSGALNFANGTWNLVGDDSYMGDCNIGGQLCIMGANGTTGLSFHKYGDASIRKSITFDGNTLYMNGSCDYATLSNQTNLLAINTVPNKTAATSIGNWSPISGRYVFHQKWTDTSTGSDSADFGIYLDGNLTANMVLDGYYNSLLGFRVIGATGGFLKANGTIDNSTYLTSHQSLSNYYTKSEVDTKLNSKLNYRLFWERTNIDLNNITEAWHTYEVNNGTGTANTPTNASWHQAVQWGTGDTDYAVQLCTAYTSNYSLYLRHKIAGKWYNWIQLAATTDIPSSLKNPYSFNVFGVTYDGSAAKTVTTSTFVSQLSEGTSTVTDGTMFITSWASNSGFADTNAVNVPYKRKAIHLWEYIKTKTDSLYATKGHNHDDRYLKLTGGIMTGTINRRSGGSTISGRDHAIIRQTYAPGGSSWNPIACVDTETGTWTLGHLSSGSSDTNFHFCFSTNADYNAGNNNGNYVTLRNKVGTIALLSEIPDKNSWNYDDRYLKLTGGTMNGNARIGHGSGNLYIGNSGNDGWLAVQDICSQDSIGDGKWSIRVDGTASFQRIKFPSNRLIAQVSNGSNSPLKGIKLPDLQNSGIGIFSRVGNGSDEGGIVLSEDTCVIYNSFDTGWGLSVRDKDITQTDISGDNTIAFGVRQDYRAYSLGGFEKSGSDNSYVLLGGGGHKLESSLNVANADKLDGYHANGLLTALSNSNNGISITVGGTTKSVSNISVNYASSAGNADTVDGEHAYSFVRAGNYESADLNKLDTYSFIKSVNSNNKDTSPKGNTGWYNVIQAVHRNGGGDGPGYIGQIALGMTTNTDDMFFRGRRTDSWKTVIHSGNIGSQTVASATKLATARSIWGQSFNGTADVNGTIYINNSDSSNGAIRLNNNVNSNARISAIRDQVIFNTGNAIRFGETAWDWNVWAGLKYTHSNKTIYLGLADNSIFNANSAQSGGTLNLRAGISNIDLNSGTSIRGLPTDGSPYSSSITLSNASISLSAYGDISMSTGPGAIKLTAGQGAKASIGSDFKIESSRGVYLTSGQDTNASINPEGFKVEASRGVYLNSGNLGNVYLCQGGGRVGIGTSSPLHKLHVMGDTFTKGFGITPYYLSDSNLLPTISPGDGYVYRCLEIGKSTKISCIIADRVSLSGSIRGVLLNFNEGFDGQIVLLKDFENYGSGNGYFWVMPSGCTIIRPDGSSTEITYNQISNKYDDGKSRFFVYSSKYKRWIEFYCG